jgi:hypothetical protein
LSAVTHVNRIRLPLCPEGTAAHSEVSFWKGSMQAKKICAYCEKPGKMTREHIFPTWLIGKTPTYDLKFSRIKRKYHSNEGVVYDVCKKCNEGPLSQLDDYVRELHEISFVENSVRQS